MRATPIPVGDVAARQQLAALATEQARLGYDSALASLEAQALLAAQRVRLSQTSLTFARVRRSPPRNWRSKRRTTGSPGAARPTTDLAQAQLMLAQAQSGACNRPRKT